VRVEIMETYQVQNTSGCLFLFAMLGEVEQAGAGLAGPGGGGVCGLLALGQVVVELLSSSGLGAEPEEMLLGWLQEFPDAK
jgi:hypothetical protein